MSRIWERPNPKQRHRRMTPAQKAAATKAAHRAGRSRPSLVDNIRAMRSDD
jgi:hypothetical protein